MFDRATRKLKHLVSIWIEAINCVNFLRCVLNSTEEQGYSPLGSPGSTWLKSEVLKNPVLVAAAEKLGKTPAQVALRWGLQAGHSILPKSTNESRIKENFDVFNWSIPDDLLAKLSEIQQMGAAAICADDPVPSVSDLADQVLEVLNYFRLGAIMCMGVMAGAYILTLFVVMSNLLYYYGMRSLLKDCLLYRYFSKDLARKM